MKVYFGLVRYSFLKKIAGGNISLYLDIYQKGLRKKETLLKDVDKEFCKGFITFLKTCTYNDGNNDSHAFDLCAIGT